ncbi:MAG: N-acetyltransferase family protein [Planctomycetota bacterium]
MSPKPASGIRPARPGDESHVARFIRDLARYEKLEHELDLSEDRLKEHLFGETPVCSCLIAESDGVPVGFALYFTSYSTFWCQPCLFLEDLFVDPKHRGGGHGLALLRALAKEAVRRKCPRLDWHVLDWNQLAIDFYRRQGADVMPDWRTCRLTGDALRQMADS